MLAALAPVLVAAAEALSGPATLPSPPLFEAPPGAPQPTPPGALMAPPPPSAGGDEADSFVPSPGRRQRLVPGPLRRGVHELKDPAGWPAEPTAPPAPVEPAAFERAVVSLCREVAPAATIPALATAMREEAEAAGADPFLVAALAYRQSRCNAAHKSPGGLGLLQIQPGMFAANARLPFPRADLDKGRLLDVRHNLRVGLALLRLWADEHLALDARGGSTPHRTAVSHFVWGDRVWGATAEDRVLAARRRLLEAYENRPPAVQPSSLSLAIVSPLEGAPRLATSGPGADREGGAREHRGLDIDATVGEPVRAVADGVVQFAGVDMPGRQPARALSPRAVRRYVNRRNLGPGGVFVRIVHEGGVRTGYFHLNAFRVFPGQVVKAGELIGTAGRSGIRVSNSHLHFEVHQHGQLADPAAFLAAFVLPPEQTLTHELAMAEKKQRLDRERRARRRAWLRARKRVS